MFERIVVINVTRFGLFGPRLLLPEAEWLQPLASWIVYAPTVESDGNVGRGWKYLFSGSAYPVTSSFLFSTASDLEEDTNVWHSSFEPMTWPLLL